MEFKITTNIDKYVKRFGPATEKQFNRALLNALNDVTFQAKKDLRRYAESHFDNPIALTKNPALVEKAKLTPTGAESKIWLKDKFDMGTKGSGPAEYLKAQITGGKRADKRSEKLLRIKGILPAGKQTVVTPAYQNRFGNITLGLIQKILSDLQAYSYSGTMEQNRPARYYKPRLARRGKYKVGKGNKTVGKYFVIPGKGIFERKGGEMRAILIFVPNPTYRKNYYFHRSVASSVFTNFRRRFGYQFGRAQGK